MLKLLLQDGSTELIPFEEGKCTEAFRHTAAHILAQAVKRLFPKAKLGIGPAIENGFYYDFDVETPFSNDDLLKIEKEMKKIVKEKLELEVCTMSFDEAKKLFTDADEPYKLELIFELEEKSNESEESQPLTYYKQGEFIDLCAGPHLAKSADVKAFKLLSATGAYWRGSEKNPMLCRVYGTAFPKASMLEEYLEKLEQAKLRDHNKLGRELEIFTTCEDVGQGLPILLPKGAKIIQILQRWVEDTEEANGYQLTKTPSFAKPDLYKISGHWQKYKDGMFVMGEAKQEYASAKTALPFWSGAISTKPNKSIPPQGGLCPSGVGVSRRSKALQADCSTTKSPTPPLSSCQTRVSPKDGLCSSVVENNSSKDTFALRPMTCPFQFQAYLSKGRSYRDLPLRYSETATLFRNESSGEMHGLIRLRQFTLADGHVICTPEQLESEFVKAIDLVVYMMKTLGLYEDVYYRFSKWDKNTPEKYMGEPEQWEKTQDLMREILDKSNVDYYEADGEAAFYGPKLDMQMKNVHGKEDTLFTVQIDFQLAEKFGMVYTDAENTKQYPYIIHRSAFGCYERTLALLIEKYSGAFPLWLAPVQVKILPIADRHNDYCEELCEEFRKLGIRYELDTRTEKIGMKIRDAQLNKTPYMLVIGDKEVEDKAIAVRNRKGDPDGLSGVMSFEDFCNAIMKEIACKVIV
ncbi:MAG: His/Gly/Thr/Pro-type tRNA ligase C-terminal domain-containing protein [Oscillospiraceae bacterium]|nr:His/Gly/Thr/Pro-type tRNA ligase C-terminal domain-containing protein [Oscillospiraceae bacterium]